MEVLGLGMLYQHPKVVKDTLKTFNGAGCPHCRVALPNAVPHAQVYCSSHSYVTAVVVFGCQTQHHFHSLDRELYLNLCATAPGDLHKFSVFHAQVQANEKNWTQVAEAW